MTNLKDKRVLITGGTGFLGRHIASEVRRRGAAAIFSPKSCEYDLTRAEQVDKLFSAIHPEIVIHAAAAVGGIGANRANPGKFFHDNALMGIHVIDAARRYAAEKTVVLGTICAYPKFTPAPFQEKNLWAGYPEETNAPYGLAKRMLLVQCQAYREQYGMQVVYLLPVNLYGPYDNFDLETSHVIPALIRKCVEGVREGAPTIKCWGDGTPTREFLYVHDAAQAIVAATERYDGASPVNIGSGEEISIRELAETIAHLTGFEGDLVWDVSQPNGQPRRFLDVSQAEREFGFRASTTLVDGLRATIEWFSARCSTRPLKMAALRA